MQVWEDHRLWKNVLQLQGNEDAYNWIILLILSSSPGNLKRGHQDEIEALGPQIVY